MSTSLHSTLMGAVTAAALALAPAIGAAQAVGAPVTDAAAPAEVMPDDTRPELVVKEVNGIPFVSGGVSDNERDAMRDTGGRFNLRVRVATADGHLVGGGGVRIDDARGQTVLDTPTNGPIFLTKLPPGQYRVRVTAEGHSSTHAVTVPRSGMEELGITVPVRAGDAPEPAPR